MKEKIRKILKEKNAILLAHNYEPPEIQDVADLCGDSLELSIKAAQTDADIIVFCGVHFMAETASILSPDKTVLLPATNAGCPMADMVTPESLKNKIAELNGIPVITYVNSSAAVKALSTICCTSANVIKVVNSLDADEVLMTPDRNLAQYAKKHTTKKIHLWEGYCPFHNTLSVEDVAKAKAQHPDALFMAHPECPPQILELADTIQSTSGMIKFALESKNESFIVGTEVGLLHPLKKAAPSKQFFAASAKMYCPDMKRITPESIYKSISELSGEVKVPEAIRIPALKAVKAMVDLAV
jgi:quinolinate synthase